MGSSLTGTKIKNTYDSILKVSDNGVLGASAKLITDGLGNSSGVYLGTSGNVGIGESSPTATFHVNGGGDSTIAIFESTDPTSAIVIKDDTGSSSIYSIGGVMRIDASSGTQTLRLNDLATVEITEDNIVDGATLRLSNTHNGSDWGLNSKLGVIDFYSTDASAAGVKGAIELIQSSGSTTNPSATDLVFKTYSSATLSEKVRITGGGVVLIGTDSVGGAGGLTIRAELNTTNYKIQLNGSGVSQAKVMELGTGQLAPGYGALRMSTANPGNGKYITFNAPDGSYNYADRGYIELSGTSILYTSVSDYRLKENVVSLTGALDRVDALKPCRFNFINDEDIIDGFLAHEVKEVVPHAVSGEKDAFTLQSVEVSPAVLDEEGKVITEAVYEEQEMPSYQGIDQSKIVPLLVAAIQELRAELNALKQA